METLIDIKEGDVFYIQFYKTYFFMQVIHIAKNLPPPYDKDRFKYGYFLVVFEKAYKKLPNSIDELDLQNIYKVKYKPKDTVLFISHWDNLPEIKLKPNRIDYEKYKKHEIKYFGNRKVSNNFVPAIAREFTMPSQWKSNDDGIKISHSPDDINWVFYILEQDKKYRTKKIEKMDIKYFKEWQDTVEPNIIKKIEDLIQKYEKINENIGRELKKCVNGINKLEEKYSFIGTIEREDIYMVLEKISKKHDFNDFEEIIENNRDW